METNIKPYEPCTEAGKALHDVIALYKEAFGDSWRDFFVQTVRIVTTNPE